MMMTWDDAPVRLILDGPYETASENGLSYNM